MHLWSMVYLNESVIMLSLDPQMLCPPNHQLVLNGLSNLLEKDFFMLV